MANISRTVDVIFNGKDALSPVVGQVAKGLKEFSAAADVVIDKVDYLADSFKKTAFASAALAGTLGGLAVNEFQKYEAAMIDLVKVSSKAEVEQAGTAKAIEDLSLTYGVSSETLLRSAVDFRRTGISVSDSLILVRNGLELASAGNTDMATSTDFLIRIMKGFGFEAKEMRRTVDVLNKISDTYATNVEELGVAMSRVSPIAKSAGLSLEETAALVTPIIEVFQSGEEAGTALRRGLSKLTDDAAPVQEALKSLGVAQRDQNGELRAGRDILFDVAKAFEGATESNKIFITSQLFGQRQGAKLIKLFEDWSYVMGVEAVASSADFQYTIDQVNLRLEATQARLAIFRVALENFGVAIGAKLGPGVRAALDGVSDLLAKIAGQVKEGVFDELFQSFSELGERLEDYFAELGHALPKALAAVDYSGLVGSVKSLLKTINDSFEGLDLTKPADLRKAIQFVIDTMQSGIETAEGMLRTYRRVKNVILENIKAFNSLSSEQRKGYGDALATADVMERTGKVFGLLLTQMDSFATISGLTTRILSDLAAVAKNEFELVIDVMKLGVTSFVRFQLGMVNIATLGLLEATTGVMTKLKESQKEITDDIGDASQKLTNHHNRIMKDLANIGLEFDELGSQVDLYSKKIRDVPKQLVTDVEINIEKETKAAEIDETLLALEQDVMRIREKRLSDESRKAAKERTAIWEQYKNDRVKLSEEAADQGTKFLGKFTEESLNFFRETNPKWSLYDKTVDEALSEKEIEPPEDKKFEAAQKKILADIEANTERVKAKYEFMSSIAETEGEKLAATFESVGESITSTGDLLSSLYQMARPGQLVDFTVQQRIAEEERRREESFQTQKRLSEAQIKLAEARTAALAAGDPVITVSGDGLKPHLEAFMWEILEAVQVRVSEEQANFLLGVN